MQVACPPRVTTGPARSDGERRADGGRLRADCGAGSLLSVRGAGLARVLRFNERESHSKPAGELCASTVCSS